jgi:hypothetical protein
MKIYIDRKPPGWKAKSDAPVIVVSGEEERAVRDSLYAFSDMWRKLGRRADEILNHNVHADRVDICSESGEIIRSVERARPNKPG